MMILEYSRGTTHYFACDTSKVDTSLRWLHY